MSARDGAQSASQRTSKFFPTCFDGMSKCVNL